MATARLPKPPAITITPDGKHNGPVMVSNGELVQFNVTGFPNDPAVCLIQLTCTFPPGSGRATADAAGRGKGVFDPGGTVIVGS